MRNLSFKVRMLTAFMTIMFLLTSASEAKVFTIALFAPRHNEFWAKTSVSMKAAADNLGMKLVSYISEDNRFKQIRQVKEAISGPNKVDAIVFNNFKGNAAKIIKLAEDAKVFAFLFNSFMSNENREKMGKPREKYKYWIGELYPDEISSGSRLVSRMIDKAKAMQMIDDKGKINLLGFNGPIRTGATIMRRTALENALKLRNDVNVLQVVNIRSSETTAERLPHFYKRHPQTKVIWTATGELLNGVLEGLKKLNLEPGKDILTSGYDMPDNIFENIESGKLEGTVGGHFTDAVWVTVLLHDYFNGADFAHESVSFMQPLVLLTRDNVHLFRKINEENFSETGMINIDFKRFSKALNPSLEKYTFSIEAILNQF